MADSSVQDQFEAQAKCLQQHGVQPVRRRAAAAHAAAPRQRALGTACRGCGPPGHSMARSRRPPRAPAASSSDVPGPRLA